MTEPRKTPRTDGHCLTYIRYIGYLSIGGGEVVESDFARTLESETQELAKALEKIIVVLEEWHDDMPEHVGDKEPAILSAARSALASHRAKQEVQS